MTCWFLYAGSLPTLITGTSPSTVTPPPPPRVLVELHLSGHPNPRQVAQQDHRKPLSPSLPLDLAAGDRRRRNMATLSLLWFGPQPKDLGLEDLKTQGFFCKAIDSVE
jgi:hypothetical protein